MRNASPRSAKAPHLTPLFIMGSIRSGTSLLQSLLDGHPELVVDAGESKFFDRSYRRLRFATAKRRAGIARRHLLHIFQPGGDYHAKFLQHVSCEEVARNFERNLEASRRRLSEFLPAYVLAYGEASGQLTETCRYWVEKTPYSELRSRLLLKWYPEARFIYVVRDPRDVFSSIKVRALRKASKADAASFAVTWRASVRKAKALQRRLGGQRVLIVRYEELADDTRKVTAELRAFLGIADDPVLSVPTKGAGRVLWEGNRSSTEKSIELSPRVTYDWQSLLSDGERRALSYWLARDALDFGYELCPAAGRPSLRERALQQLRRLLILLRFESGIG